MKSWFTEKKKDSPTLRHSRTIRPKISHPIPIVHDWQSNTPTEENNYPTAFNDSNRLDYRDSVESPLSLTPQQNIRPDLQPDFASPRWKFHIIVIYSNKLTGRRPVAISIRKINKIMLISDFTNTRSPLILGLETALSYLK